MAADPIPVVFVIGFQSSSRANGAIESITSLLEGLRNVRPVVVTNSDSPVSDRWRAAGADVHVWPLLRPVKGYSGGNHLVRKTAQIAGLVWSNVAMYRLLRSTKAKVVHCNEIGGLRYTGLGARAAGARIVLNIRDVRPPGRGYSGKWLAVWLASRIVVLSREMRDAIEAALPRFPVRAGARSVRQVEYIYSIVGVNRMGPVSPQQRGELRQRLGLEPDAPAIGCVGRLVEKKAQLPFIEQAGLLIKREIPNARVYLLGGPEPADEGYALACKEAVRRLGLEEIFLFAGYRDDIGDWYRALDMTVLPSRNEGLARAMIESISCGTPVVSFDVCSAREVLEEHHCGSVVPQGDYRMLVQAMTSIAASAPLRAELGANGARVAGDLFAPGRRARQYENIYASLAVRAHGV